MSNYSTNTNVEKLIEQLHHADVGDPENRHLVNALTQLMTADINSGQDEITELGEEVVKRKVTAPNRAKPVGLRFGLPDVIAMQDEDFVEKPLKYKQRSFVESWHYFTEYSRNKTIRRDLIIKDVAIAFRTADLPTPDVDDLEQWIHDRFREFNENAGDGLTAIV